jgi:predicted dehydrogenase
MAKQLKIAVIGLGYWGPNYVRIFNELPESAVLYGCDLNNQNLKKIKKQYPKMRLTKDYKKIGDEIDAAVVVTPLNTHYEIAKYFLQKGKHVLVEKPFTDEVIKAEELNEIARQKKLVLMVGHIYRYNPWITALEKIIKKGELGKIFYIESERVALGPIRKHESALWDLADHDISIALFLLGTFPNNVDVEGECFIQKDQEDFINLSLKFPNHALYCSYDSWYAPEKQRKLTVVGSKGMAVFDEMDKGYKLKIYRRKIEKKLLDKTPEYEDHQKIVKSGDVYVPEIKVSEPLRNEAKHFLQCIIKKSKPITDGNEGLRVVKVLKAAEQLLMNQKCREIR